MSIPITMNVAIAVRSVSCAAFCRWAVFATTAALLNMERQRVRCFAALVSIGSAVPTGRVPVTLPDVVGTRPTGDTRARRVSGQKALSTNGGAPGLDENDEALSGWKENGIE